MSYLSYQVMSLTDIHSQLCMATSISSFVQYSDFISAIPFVSWHGYFNQNFAQVIP